MSNNNMLENDNIFIQTPNDIYETYITKCKCQNISQEDKITLVHDFMLSVARNTQPNNVSFLALIIENVLFKPDIIHADIHTKKLDDFSEFMSEIGTYGMTDKNLAQEFIVNVIRIIRKLSKGNRYTFTSYLWSIPQIRELVDYDIFGYQTTGYLYMKSPHSLFSIIFSDDNVIIEDINNATDTFDTLINHVNKHGFLLDYLNDIFIKNIRYTYDNITDNHILSTFDFCVFCFNLTIKIIRTYHNDFGFIMDDVINNVMHEKDILIQKMLRTFWNGVNVVFFTSYVMKIRISNTYILCSREVGDTITNANNNDNNLIDSITVVNKINELKEVMAKGAIMLGRLDKYITTFDTLFIMNMIFSEYDYLILNVKYDIFSRLIDNISDKSITEISDSLMSSEDDARIILSSMVHDIIKSTMPKHIKYDVMRILMSHDLIYDFINVYGIDTINQYILTYVLETHIDVLHIVDILICLSDYDHTNRDGEIIDCEIIEYCLYLTPKFELTFDWLSNLLKRLLGDDTFAESNITESNITESNITESNIHQKTQGINDFQTLIKAYLMVVGKIHKLGNHALSYISDIVSFMSKINNHGMNVQNLRNKLIDIMRNISHNTIIISNTTYDILKDNFSITKDIFDCIKVYDAAKLDNDILDIITYDIAINPYYITTGKDESLEYYLIDRKTYYHIMRCGSHPFTRENITINELELFNISSEVMLMKSKVTNKIKLLLRT